MINCLYYNPSTGVCQKKNIYCRKLCANPELPIDDLVIYEEKEKEE